MIVRTIFILIFIGLLASCSEKLFEKDFYERVSHIKFPEEYKVLETFDNGEWLTGTVLSIDSSILRKMIVENHFDTLRKIDQIHFMSNGYLSRYKADIKTIHGIYFISRSEKKNDWTYIADIDRNMLWAEISYPDWGGR